MGREGGGEDMGFISCSKQSCPAGLDQSASRASSSLTYHPFLIHAHPHLHDVRHVFYPPG